MRIRPVYPPTRAALLLLAALLPGACREAGDTLRTTRRARLAAPLAEGTLAMDSAGRAWIGERGAVWALDSLGRPGARFVLPGAVLRVAWAAGGELAVRSAGGGLRLVDDSTGAVRVTRRESRLRPLARDPRGRWLYAAT
ncbi:MAG TPA: hypothetical protein VFX98_12150, partial [Longimicrobiaceae bacterium]|nr:hypothetical protein [Longimicrobiaceae bacterium]